MGRLRKIFVLGMVLGILGAGYALAVEDGFEKVQSISAIIDSYSPSSQITVEKGKSFTISFTFRNNGNTGAYFYPGASVWDSNWNLI